MKDFSSLLSLLRDKLAAASGTPPQRPAWLQIIFWVWGVGGLVISFLALIVLGGFGLGVVLFWIGGMVLLGFGDMINENESKRGAILNREAASSHGKDDSKSEPPEGRSPNSVPRN